MGYNTEMCGLYKEVKVSVLVKSRRLQWAVQQTVGSREAQEEMGRMQYGKTALHCLKYKGQGQTVFEEMHAGDQGSIWALAP
jgi:hypothetical protein